MKKVKFWVFANLVKWVVRLSLRFSKGGIYDWYENQLVDLVIDMGYKVGTKEYHDKVNWAL